MVEILSKRKWTELEDLMLGFYITIHGAGNWDTMARLLDIGRSGISCKHRWNTKLSPTVTVEQIQGAAGGSAAMAGGSSLTSSGAPSGKSDAILKELKELESFLMSDARDFVVLPYI